MEYSKLTILDHITVFSTLIITLLIQFLHIIINVLFIKGIESLWKRNGLKVRLG